MTGKLRDQNNRGLHFVEDTLIDGLDVVFDKREKTIDRRAFFCAALCA